MTYRHFKHEGWLYTLAFLIALGVRLVGLGTLPLTDAEAAPALQALHLSQSTSPALDPHPLYILSTSILFLLYGGGTNFLARLIPALVGSLLVLAPLLLDDRLKPRPSLILAFFLALDPGLVAISRQAASPILAITLLAFTAGFLNKNKLNLAVITAALALLSGPSIWLGLLGIGITFAIAQLFFKQKQSASNEEQETSDGNQETGMQAENATPARFQPAPFKFPTFQTSHLLTFFIAFLLAGTLFFTAPGGIGAAFSSIPGFFEKWVASSDISQVMLVISLLVYQPFALLLTVIALLRGWLGGLRRIVYLSIWLMVAFLLVIFLPARQMADLAWVLLPLNALASLELARHFTIYPDERREVMGVASLTVFIWVFAWLGMAGINWFPLDTPEYTLRAGMLIGSLLLLIISLVLIAAGWSIRVARLGGIWGMAIGLGLLSLGGLFGSTGLRGLTSPEMWWQPQLPLQAELLRDTVNQVSEWGRGNDNVASVAVLGIQSPAIEWALRENPVQMVDALDVTSAPDFVITSYEMNPELVSAYRGQDFIWRQSLLWNRADPGAWLRWVTLREMPQNQEIILLWARTDLFIDDEP
ncbi:MAG: hypothetical protein J0M11_05980 [Anaerolineae bacterium]|nr:hypothetical protein [Anaerolineae bacterium]